MPVLVQWNWRRNHLFSDINDRVDSVVAVRHSTRQKYQICCCKSSSSNKILSSLVRYKFEIKLHIQYWSLHYKTPIVRQTCLMRPPSPVALSRIVVILWFGILYSPTFTKWISPSIASKLLNEQSIFSISICLNRPSSIFNGRVLDLIWAGQPLSVLFLQNCCISDHQYLGRMCFGCKMMTNPYHIIFFFVGQQTWQKKKNLVSSGKADWPKLNYALVFQIYTPFEQSFDIFCS